MNEPIQLVTTKPDKELAEELKKELIEAAKSWQMACTKALSMGFHVQASFGNNAFNQVVLNQLDLIKKF